MRWTRHGERWTLNVFLLDTDHLGILQRRSAPEHLNLTYRMRQHPLEDFFVSIVSFHEQVTGWSAYVRRARGGEGLVWQKGAATVERDEAAFVAGTYARLKCVADNTWLSVISTLIDGTQTQIVPDVV